MSFEWFRSSIAPAVLGVFAAFISGCTSTPAALDESLAPSDKATALVSKLDEALIGTYGPKQVEEAIETLDSRTQSDSPLVRELGGIPPTLATPADLFDRIRAGFGMTDVNHPTVDAEERWYARHPGYLDRTFKRGERYLFHIVNEIEARNMPMELALLPVVESAFNPVAYSRARASGLWQFIPGTGRRYGLKQNWYYDGRRDVLAATSAALDYLEFLVNEFDGDWLLAVAAYNSGEGNVARAMRRNREAGKPTDFFSLNLPRETRAYVPKLLAMRRIMADPVAHGLLFATIPDEPYFEKVQLASQIDLHVAAELAAISKEELLALNPAFNRWVTDPEGPHHLLVPIANATRFATAVAELPPRARVRVVSHRVRRGDTLAAIAAKYGVSVASLRTSNKIRDSIIHPDQDLIISGSHRAVQTLASVNPTSVDQSVTYIVRSGDSPSRIASRFRVRLGDLLKWNRLNTRSIIKPGQRLVMYVGHRTGS